MSSTCSPDRPPGPHASAKPSSAPTPTQLPAQSLPIGVRRGSLAAVVRCVCSVRSGAQERAIGRYSEPGLRDLPGWGTHVAAWRRLIRARGRRRSAAPSTRQPRFGWCDGPTSANAGRSLTRVAALPVFDFAAFCAAFDAGRRDRGLSWYEFADELWQQSSELNAHRSDHPL
jgi:hypothetical protein